MTPERWAAAQALFESALAAPDAGRSAFVDAAANGDADLAALVHGLLAADAEERSGASIAAVVRDAMAEVTSAPRPAPERLGPYRIRQLLGEGGMGAVYLAERDDDEFLQQVAIKVARGLLDPERVRQFRTERQILAWLEHPNIARLLDGGTTADGLPYLVMEFVEGVPIDRYCDEARLDVTARLRLFLAVCDAVSHAHRSLIVHRDIKPSNIMVTAGGTPKLLDFGIARLALDGGHDTGPAPSRMMTPFYASPEVVRGGQVTTSADVYALGVLLHELLTGTRPLRFRTMTSEEVERVVCHVDPRPPSQAAHDTDAGGAAPDVRAALRQATPASLAARLQGDLDAIVALALDKDPVRRYASAEALAADIRHALDHRPVAARPASWAYVASRFVARHRWGTAAAAVALTAVLAAAVAFSVQARRLADERDKTARERDTAQQVSSFLIDLFEESNPDRTGTTATVTARDLLERGAGRIDGDLAGQPVVQARLLATIGAAFSAQGDFARALTLFERALELRRATLGPDDLDTVTSMTDVAETYRRLSRLDDAERLHRDALAARRRLGAPPSAVATSLNDVGITLSERGRYGEAEPLLREAITIWRQHEGPASDLVASGLNNLAYVLRQQARLGEAAPILEDAITIRRQALGGAHPSLALLVGHLGQVYNQQGEFARAEPLLREALAIRQRVYGDDHPATINARNNLTSLLHDQGDLAGVEPLYRAALASLELRLGREHPDVAVQLNNLASLLDDARRYGEAETLLRQSLAIRVKSFGPTHAAVARVQHNLGRTLLGLGRAREAEALARTALATRLQTLPAGHFELAINRTLLGEALAAGRHTADAEPLLVQAVADLRAELGPDHPGIADSLLALAAFYRRTGRPALAEPDARAAVDVRTRKLAAGHWKRAVAEVELATVCLDLGRPAEAARLLGPATEVLARRLGAGDPRVAEARTLLAAATK